MTENYPTSIDSYSTKIDNVDVYLADHVNTLQVAIVSLQTKLGSDSSSDTNSIDYILNNHITNNDIHRTIDDTGSSVTDLWSGSKITLELSGKESNLTFGTGLTRIIDTITTNDSEIDHNSLTNTHNLTTDIDHNLLTNTHNLTTDIDHNTITNNHNLTTDIDHNTITNNHNLTTSIDHNTITNTHNLTTDIDHNTITNTHNLTTDINHNALTNYDIAEHRTISDTTKLNTDLWSAEKINNDHKKYAGFENRTDSVIAMNGNNFEITTATNYNVYINGVGKKNITSTLSIEITEDQNITYVYLDWDGTNVRINKSTSPWHINDGTNIPLAIVFKDNLLYAITDERHGYNRNLDWHRWAHLTIGAMYRSGLPGTFNTIPTFSIGGGTIFDEDIRFDIATQTTTSLWYRNSTDGMRLLRNSTSIYKYNVDTIQWDNGSGILQDVGNNNYYVSWVYASNDSSEPIYTVIGQGNHANLNDARGEAQPIINLSTAEWKLLYKVILRNTPTPNFIEASDLRTVQTGVPTQQVSPTSHSILTDREATNSHPATAIQYDATYNVKEKIDLKQDILVSGTNIKTINSNDITGSGDVSVGTVTSVTSANTDIDVSNGTTTPALTLNAATSGANKIVRLTSAGLLDESIMPPLAIIDTHVVASEIEQLALTVQKGDIAIRTDLNKTYINKTGNNTAMTDWEQLIFPSGGGSVTSVQAGNGMDFTEIISSGSVNMGTPSSITASTTNTTSGTTHTHELDQSTINHNSLTNTHNLTTDINHNTLTNYDVGQHRTINDSGTAVTDLWSGSKINTDLGGKAATNQSMFIGTTGVAINRASAALSLTGTSIDGSANSIKSTATTGLMTITGPAAATTRAKTVRNANDTILELAGSYTPTGNWTNMKLVTPTLGTPASGLLTNCTVTTNVTIANTDRLLISDASDTSKIRGGVAFGTSTTTYLNNAGAFSTPPNTTYTEISDAEIINTTSSTARLISGRRMNTALNKKISVGSTAPSGPRTNDIWIDTT